MRARGSTVFYGWYMVAAGFGLQLLAAGLTNSQIAERLTLSTYTVQAHLRSIYSKLGVSTRVAAARAATQFKQP